jgi:two-component system, cell cycle sensor histidine kinase and response regulator CckA
MASFADVGNTLQVLAGVSLILGAAMAVYWGTRRGYPGFGLWTVCNILFAISCLLLADQAHFAKFVVTVAVPALIVLGTIMRLEGLRRFFGRPRFDYRTLAVPVIATALLIAFQYGRDDDLARTEVIVAGFFLATAGMAATFIVQARRTGKRSYLVDGALATLSCALLVAYGIYWATGVSMPLIELTRPNFAFFILVVMFEVAWFIVFLSLGTTKTTETLERAKAAVENSLGQLAAIVAFLPDATFAIDRERRVIAWNRAAEELTGMPESDALGKTTHEVALAASMEEAPTLLDLVFDEGLQAPDGLMNVRREGDVLSAELETEFPGKPGRVRHLWAVATLLRDQDGRVTGAIESLRDVSSREQAEQIIRQREQQYRSLFELSLDGILVVAPDGSVQDANPAACSMLGMTNEELRLAGHSGIVARGPGVEERLRSRAIDGRDTQEFTFIRKDRSTFSAACMSVNYRDDFGFTRAFIVFRDITEQQNAQRVLRESEARLLQAQAVAHIGNCEIDLASRSIWLSPEALRIHGLAPQANYLPLDPSPLVRILEDPGPVEAALRRLQAEGGDLDLHYRIKRPSDGLERMVRSRYEAVCDENGRPVAIHGVMQDVTDLNQADGILRLTQYSVDHSGDQIFWLDSRGHFVFVSDSTLEQLGYSREEFLGMSITDLDPTASKEGWEEGWRRTKEQGKWTEETVHRTKGGELMPVELSVTYIAHEGREYNFVYARDITQRKLAEESLSRTQLSVNHATDQVFWTSPDGRFVFVGDSTCRQLGYSRDELLGMSIFEVDRTLSRDWRSSWEMVRQRGSFTYEGVHRTKEGVDMPVEVNANYIRHNGQEYNLVFARDISERKRTEELMGVSQEKIEQARVMEAIGQIAGGIAHDFSNLLTAIIGYGNLILSNKEVHGAVARDAEEIRAAAERASALTHQILAFSRRQPLMPQTVALNEVVVGALPRIQEALGDTIEVVTVLQPQPSFVDADVRQFEQVLGHLAANARDAMPRGGKVVIEIRTVDLDEEYCRAYLDLQPGEYVLLSFSDTGMGMTLETMAHVFEPFFTTKPTGRGSGLGLSLVYGIVRQSGGYVNAYSEIGKGSTFKIYLPSVTAQARAVTEGGGTRAPGNVSGNETILVVEDEAPLRRLVARVLGGLGYQVFVAGSGPEALELLDDLERPPDLLLSDVVLPGGMQGNEVAAAFTARIPNLPVLYVSGHARDAIVHAGRLDEGVNFLAKPFTPDSLAAKVREVLDGGVE